ncbi:MAG: hypothetical protein ABEK59_00250 [Halobacteria archaeon]
MTEDEVNYGDTFAYESIVGCFPGLDLSITWAVALQFTLFEAAIVFLSVYYGTFEAVSFLAGSTAVAVSSIGSYIMAIYGNRLRSLNLPDRYIKVVFGSSIDVVLGVVAFCVFLTYHVVAVGTDRPNMIGRFLGNQVRPPVVFLMLLIIWDVCYRIGTAWWACVAGFWRAISYGDEGWRFDDSTLRSLLRADSAIVAFATLQLALVPFVLGIPLIEFAVTGHVAAVYLFSAVTFYLTYRKLGNG